MSKNEKRVFVYAISWLIIFIYGIVVYSCLYASYPTSEQNAAIENITRGDIIARSMSASFDLFFFNVENNAVDGWITATPSGTLGWLLTLASIMAGIWTIALIILLLWALLKRWINSCQLLLKKQTKLYIFVGVNYRSKILAQDIMAKEGNDAICLFLVPPASTEDGSSVWDKMLKVVHYKHALYQDLGDLNAQILIAEKRIVDYNEQENSDIWAAIGLPIIHTYIRNSVESHILLLSDNEKDNLLGAINIKKGVSSSTKIICLARRNSINRSLEDQRHKEGEKPVEIKVIDNSFIAIEELKSKSQYHPIHFMDFNPNNVTTVDSAFHSLIIGFSECGQDALRFLYEFSAFVDSKSVTEAEKAENLKIVRNPFYCDIIDPNPDDAAMKWMHNAKELFSPDGKHNPDGEIRLHTINARGEEFYRILDGILRKLNYVVIAVGNDMTGISIAADMMQYAMRKAKPLEKFKIFVRVYETQHKKYMEEIAKQYNIDGERIVLFGEETEIFTKERIIDDKFMELGKIFQHQYEDCRVKNEEKEHGQAIYPQEYWDERREKVMKRTEYTTGSYEAIQDLRRKESQDRANALHALTKLTLRDIISLKDDKENILRERMAWLEHLRWVAAHELMGYSLADKRTIVQYQHNCMVGWEKLADSNKNFDRAVWDTTLALEEQYILEGLYTPKKTK